MKKCVFLVILSMVLVFAFKPLNAEPYVTLKVSRSDGGFAMAYCWMDELNNASWIQEADYLDQPQIAFDLGSVKYGELGPSVQNDWTAYIWAGNRVVDGTLYNLTILPWGKIRAVAKSADGLVLFDQIVLANGSFSWNFSAVHATTAQWRTKGNKVTIVAVPEPSSFLALSGAIFALTGFLYRRL